MASLPALRARAALLRLIRSFFESRGSLEVETPALLLCPGLDANVDGVEALLRTAGAQGGGFRRWLATSPEYHMKRLLAEGSGAIHQIGKAWRDGEAGRQHEPEFTLLEWYVPGADDAALMDETEALVRAAATALSDGRLSQRDRLASAGLAGGPGGEPFARLTFAEAFQRHAGFDPKDADPRRLGLALRAAGVRPPRSASRDELLDLVLAAVVQPRLGWPVPCFVTDWPAERAALARVRPGRDADGRPAAARFELYACGVELCNGYHELRDAVEQRARIDAENRARAAAGREPYPVDEEFLAALQRMPDCAGNALGVDRLLMLLLGAEDIGEVRAFRLDLSTPAAPRATISGPPRLSEAP
jgi:lysyl-tRNA synthetase class 2